jgi:hypothetical protein
MIKLNYGPKFRNNSIAETKVSLAKPLENCWQTRFPSRKSPYRLTVRQEQDIYLAAKVRQLQTKQNPEPLSDDEITYCNQSAEYQKIIQLRLTDLENSVTLNCKRSNLEQYILKNLPYGLLEQKMEYK